MVELEGIIPSLSCAFAVRARAWAACGCDLATTTSLVRKVLNNKYTFLHFTVTIEI